MYSSSNVDISNIPAGLDLSQLVDDYSNKKSALQM